MAKCLEQMMGGSEHLSPSFCSVIQQWEQHDQLLASLPASVSLADALLPCGFITGDLEGAVGELSWLIFPEGQ